MTKHFFNILIVSLATLGSRILGLFRDILIFSFLGTSGLNSAFILAFTLPNLFRRLFGEGVLTSAFVPIFSQTFERHQRSGALRMLNQTLTRLGIFLLLLVAAVTLALQGIRFLPDLSERWYLAAHLGSIVFPYVLLVCFAAILAGALNTLRRFALAALSPIWLNLAIIGSLGIVAYTFGATPEAQVYYLCGGVLVGGIVQLVVPICALRREGWRPGLDLSRSGPVREVMQLFGTGVVGASILQINALFSRLLAFSLNAEAVSFLYLANRLIELPLGLFTIAIVTVIFPQLSRFAAQRNQRQFAAEFSQGIRFVLILTLPATVGLVLLRQPILILFFEWGVFSVRDVSLASSVVGIFAIGLPFYSIALLTTRGLHALKDMHTVTWIAIGSFFINLGLSLVFMRLWSMQGLALANVLAMALQTLHLYYWLRRRNAYLKESERWQQLSSLALPLAAMGAVCLSGHWLIEHWMGAGTKSAAFMQVVILIPLAAGLYFLLLGWIGSDNRLTPYVKTLWSKIRLN